MKKQTIYIAGKITGLDPKEARMNFKNAQEYIESATEFFIVKNPMQINAKQNGHEWKDYMLKDIEVLFNCNAIYMLKNWKDSKGARIEHCIAIEMNKYILYQQSEPLQI